MSGKFPYAAAIFDMDHTLIDNDCDVSWKEFAVANRLTHENALEEAEKYYLQYLAGTLDIDEFLLFQLHEFTGKQIDEMEEWSCKHYEDMVKNKIYADAAELVTKLKKAKIPVAVLSSTNDVIVRPVARALGIDEIIGTTLNVAADGRYDGNIKGAYTVGGGKVKAALDYCRRIGVSPGKTAYFGDSYNDRFVMAEVGFPFAVNPDERLRMLAQEKMWEIVTFE